MADPRAGAPPAGGGYTHVQASIAEGESLSDPIDCTGGTLVMLMQPNDWDDAPLTFQVSPDGSAYGDLFQLHGPTTTMPTPASAEIAMGVIPGVCVLMGDSAVAQVWTFLKLRSGTRDNPVPQTATRQFDLWIKPK